MRLGSLNVHFLQKVIFHEEYGQPDDYQNDIALIKLDREVGEG